MAYEFTPEEELILNQLEIHEDSRVWPVTLPEKFKFGQTEIRGLAALLRSLATQIGGSPTVASFTRATLESKSMVNTDVAVQEPDLVIDELDPSYAYQIDMFLSFGQIGGPRGVNFGIFGTDFFADTYLKGAGKYWNSNTFPYGFNELSFSSSNSLYNIDLGDGSSEFDVEFHGVIYPYGITGEPVELSVWWGPSVVDEFTPIYLRAGAIFRVTQLPNVFFE